MTISRYSEKNALNYQELKNLKNYSYQKILTKILDEKTKNLDTKVDQNYLNEIVLWKVNRYAAFNDETILLLNRIKEENAEEINTELTKEVLSSLLKTPGVQLPMASTILRFMNPKIYQIYDQRVGRFIDFENPHGGIQSAKNEALVAKTVDFYLGYLQRLQDISKEKNVEFELLDRVLYIADKEENKDIALKKK
jgi:hypothetical protein